MALHNSQSDGTHHPAGYFQSGDPGAVGAGKYWVDTTAAAPYPLKIRNSGDSAWEDVGSAGGASFDPTDTTTSWFNEDFVKNGDGGGIAHDWWVTNNDGSFPEIASVAGHPGIRSMAAGAGTTAWSLLARGYKELLLGGGATVAKCSINIQNLSDATDEYDFFWGHLDSVNPATITDGVYFRYDRSTSTNWLMVTRSAGTETITATTTAVATGWVALEIRVNAAGTSAAFYIDGSEAANSPLTTNIPTGAGRETGHASYIIKSAGTAARAVWIDYWMFKQTLTAAR